MLDKLWDARTFRVLFTALVFGLVLVFLRDARETLTLFLFAILFAYFVEPLVSRLQKPLRGRIQGIAAVYVLLIAVVAIAGFLIGPRIADEGKSLMTTLPSLLDRIASGQLITQMGQAHGWDQARLQQVQAALLSHRAQIVGYGGSLAAKLAAPISHIWWLILIPILSLFFLKDGNVIAVNLVQSGRTREDRETLAGIVSDVNIMLGSYIRAQLLLASLTLVVVTLVLALLHMPYAFILGPLAGICEFVPVVGPAVAAVTIFGIGVLAGFPHLLFLFFFLGAWRLIQDYVSAPRIMGQSLEISPLAQIFGVLAGGEIGGVVGALISVPVLAILRILLRRLRTGDGQPASKEPVRVSQLPDKPHSEMN